MEEGEWRVVNRRKKRSSELKGRLDIAGSQDQGCESNTVTFYFSEFPDTHGAKVMLKAFKLYGNVVEVAIPNKVNKWGRRFGFARFLNVHGPKMFAVRLDNIIFGSKKIHVNLPRFQRSMENETGAMRSKAKYDKQGEKPFIHQTWRFAEDRGHGKEIIRNSGFYVSKARDNARPRHAWRKNYKKENKGELCFEVAEEDMANLNTMFVGVVRRPGSTHMIQEWLSMEGFFSMKITPLGANKVLMEEMEEGIIAALITDAKDWVEEFFEDVRRWSPRELDNERVVWVICHGVPMHVWKNEFFEALARKFGVLLRTDDNTSSRQWMWQEYSSELIAMTCVIWWWKQILMVACFTSRCSRNGAGRCTGVAYLQLGKNYNTVHQKVKVTVKKRRGHHYFRRRVWRIGRSMKQQEMVGRMLATTFL